jgi:hypothetical protein
MKRQPGAFFLRVADRHKYCAAYSIHARGIAASAERTGIESALWLD